MKKHNNQKFKNSVKNVVVFIVPMHPSPSESDSDISLSGFETVASHSFDEDEDDEEEGGGSVMFSIPYNRPAGMLQEDRHGDKEEAQANGITEHRSAVQYCPAIS